MAKSDKPKKGGKKSTNPVTPTGNLPDASSITGRRFFAEPPVTVDGKVTLDGKFVPTDDSKYYDSGYYPLHKKIVQSFRITGDPVFMDLGRVLSSAHIKKIEDSGEISFHAVGDTGATTLAKFNNEESVSDMMADDLKADNAPSFFFHLGDVVYNFGEERYYYDQFYEAYRKYNGPIFAIPGNHDGMIYEENMKSLKAFEDNFCTDGPQKAEDAGNLSRTTMDQPGVYFTLDAPFVSIIGLYSNVLDGNPGGIISSMSGKFPKIGDSQLTFLANELARLKEKRKTDKRAIVLAVHHPPFSGDAKNGGSPLMTKDLTAVFKKAGVLPDAILSGHAHNYQRFSWTVNGKTIPCLISGSGGFNVSPIKDAPANFPFDIPGRTDLKMEKYFAMYGCLEVTVNGKDKTLKIDFNTPETSAGPRQIGADSVTINW